MQSIFTLAADPLAHVVDSPLIGWYISNATVMLVFSAIVTALIVIPAARRIATGPGKNIDDLRSKGLLANGVEAICLYLRDQVFRPVLKEETDRFAPVLWTFFWFIWVCNLTGLIPLLDWTAAIGKVAGIEIGHHGHGIGGTATQSIWVTGALAFLAFLFYNAMGLAKDPAGYFKHLLGGAPWYVAPIMIPVELLGMVVKPVALAIRLFANMTGGHILLAVILSFVFSMIQAMGPVGYGLAIIPLLGAMAIYLLEILVATIQAFIFTFLTCIFLGQLVVHEHDKHGHEEPHEAPLAEPGEPHARVEPAP